MILIPLLQQRYEMWKIHEIKNGIRIEKNIDNKTKKDLVRSYIDEKKIDKKYEQRIRFHLKKWVLSLSGSCEVMVS